MASRVLLLLAFFAGASAARAGGPSDKELLQQAWEDMRLGRWNVAEEELARLEASAAQDVAAEALYAEGMLWMHRKPGASPPRAREAFAEVSRRFPSHPLAAWADLAIARIPDLDVLRPNPVEAAKLCLGVMQRHPGSPAAGEAAIHRALDLSSAGNAADARAAVDELERWWAAHPHPSLACATEATLGRLWRFPLDDPRRSVEHLRRALDLGPASAAQRQGICWSIARMAEERLGDRALAAEYYARFVKEFPRHQNVHTALQALKRLGAPAPKVEDVSLEGLRRLHAGGAP
jgi:outer membrane protein assembly factor BamD (BamD/ComL family)